MKGEWVERKRDEYEDVVNGGRKEVVCEVGICRKEDIDYGGERGGEGFKRW